MRCSRAKSTERVGCASDRVKPRRDVSTAAKCSWKSPEATLKPFKARFETPNRVIVLVETFKRLHVHRIALWHGRVHESNTMSPNKMVRSLDRAIANKTLVTLTQEWDCRSLRPENLRTVSPQNALSLVLVPFSCNHREGPGFAGHFSSRNCLIHGKTFHQVEFHDSRLLPLHQGRVLPTCLPQSRSHLSPMIQTLSG